MIVNPKNLQAFIIINRQNRSNHNCCLTKTLLGIEIDSKLKRRMQLNAIGRIGAVLGQQEKEN